MQQQREAQADGKDLATETLVRQKWQDINTKNRHVLFAFCRFDYIGFDGQFSNFFKSFFVCCVFFFLRRLAWETMYLQ